METLAAPGRAREPAGWAEGVWGEGSETVGDSGSLSPSLPLLPASVISAIRHPPWVVAAFSAAVPLPAPLHLISLEREGQGRGR